MDEERPDVWEVIEWDDPPGLHWRIGPLDLWVQHAQGEWQVACRRDSEDRGAQVEKEVPPADLDWHRAAATLKQPRVKAAPIMPDRSVIVRPASALSILRGQEARFFVSIPVHVRLTLEDGGDEPLTLCEEPALVLSRSWFGSPTQGEACYALRTRARRKLEDLPAAAHRALCPLLIRNDSRGTLDFERLCLRTQHLGVYRGENHLWTQEATVTYRGEETFSHIDYGRSAPRFDKAATCLSPARDVPAESLFKKTFGTLRAFAGGLTTETNT